MVSALNLLIIVGISAIFGVIILIKYLQNREVEEEGYGMENLFDYPKVENLAIKSFDFEGEKSRYMQILGNNQIKSCAEKIYSISQRHEVLIAQDEITKFIHSQDTTPIIEPEPILIQNPVAVRVIPEPSKPQSSGSVYQDPRYIPQKAYDYSQRGYKDQINFMNELIDNGFEVLEHHETEKSLPDIVALYKGEYFIYQFKAWACDRLRKKAKAHARTLYRKDCHAEIKRALQLRNEGRKVHLVIAFHNHLNDIYEVIEVDIDNFHHYSTSVKYGICD